MKELMDEFKAFVHKDPVSYFLTEDDMYMAVLQQEILNNPFPIGLDIPILQRVRYVAHHTALKTAGGNTLTGSTPVPSAIYPVRILENGKYVQRWFVLNYRENAK